MDNNSLQRKINRIAAPKYRYQDSFPSDYVATLDNDTFAIISKQFSYMQGEHWIMIANARQFLYFVDSLGRKKYSFFMQKYEYRMREPPKSHYSVCSFYTIYAAFHVFKYRQEEITGVHDIKVFSFISNYMQFFIFLIKMCGLYNVFANFYNGSQLFETTMQSFYKANKSYQYPHTWKIGNWRPLF